MWRSVALWYVLKSKISSSHVANTSKKSLQRFRQLDRIFLGLTEKDLGPASHRNLLGPKDGFVQNRLDFSGSQNLSVIRSRIKNQVLPTQHRKHRIALCSKIAN